MTGCYSWQDREKPPLSITYKFLILSYLFREGEEKIWVLFRGQWDSFRAEEGVLFCIFPVSIEFFFSPWFPHIPYSKMIRPCNRFEAFQTAPCPMEGSHLEEERPRVSVFVRNLRGLWGITLCHLNMNCSQATDVIPSNSKNFLLRSNIPFFTLK